MPNYTYTGLDRLGKQSMGQIAADDEASARQRLKASGVFLTDLRVVRESKNGHATQKSTPLFRSSKVSGSDVTVFSRQLANLVKGGLPLMRTFSALTEHTENLQLKAALTSMQKEIKNGKALWEALELHPKIFSPLYVNMVKAGEASGQLPSVLSWLAGYLEKEQSRRAQIRSALSYPTLLFCVGTLAVSLLITFVVPKFAAVFQELGQALPLPTVMLLSFSTMIAKTWWIGAIIVAALVFGLRRYVRSPRGRVKLDEVRLRIPLFGKLSSKAAISRFCRTTAMLLRGGVPLFDAMAIVRDVVGNEVLAAATDNARSGMREGGSFAERLQDTGVFPPLLSHMAAVGEETGDLEGVLITVADTYDVEVEATVKSIVSLLEPLIIIIIGSLIAFIIMAMLLPVFQINLSAG